MRNIQLPFEVAARDVISIPQNNRKYGLSLGTVLQVITKVSIPQLSL